MGVHATRFRGFLLLWLTSCGSRTALEVASGSEGSDAGDAGGLEDAPPDAPVVHDCFGAGETVLAPEEPSPTAIAVDATHVYWATAGADCSEGWIRSVPKAGGPIATLASGEPNPRAIAIDAERVYFYDGCGTGLLRSVPKRGGPVIDHPIVVSGNAEVIAVDSTNIYFNDYGLMRIPKEGGGQVEVDNQDYVYALTADDGGAYWMGPMGGGFTYGLFAYHQGDPGATLLATPDSAGQGIAIDAETIFFATSPGILRMPRAGGAASTVTAAFAWHVAVDESFVYWTDGVSESGGYSVNKAPKLGGSTTTLATGTGAYLSLAVDDGCVYWANLYGGTISRAPK